MMQPLGYKPPTANGSASDACTYDAISIVQSSTLRPRTPCPAHDQSLEIQRSRRSLAIAGITRLNRLRVLRQRISRKSQFLEHRCLIQYFHLHDLLPQLLFERHAHRQLVFCNPCMSGMSFNGEHKTIWHVVAPTDDYANTCINYFGNACRCHGRLMGLNNDYPNILQRNGDFGITDLDCQ